MQINPSIKGQLTKARKGAKCPCEAKRAIVRVFLRLMPREQAKHATRKFINA